MVYRQKYKEKDNLDSNHRIEEINTAKSETKGDLAIKNRMKARKRK